MAATIAPGVQAAHRAPDRDGPALYPGAIEIGLAGSLTAVEGTASGEIALHVGSFVAAAAGHIGFEAEVAYFHVSSLDLLGLEGALSWQPSLPGRGAVPFVSVGGGLRQEWLGSFYEARFPMGMSLGLRFLMGQGAAVRTEYRLTRVLHDPVADAIEHRIRLGVALLLRNRP